MNTEDLPARLLGVWRSRFVSVGVVLLLSAGVLCPLVDLVWDGSEGFRGSLVEEILKVWNKSEIWKLLGWSLLVSAGVTILATVTGCVEALLYFRSRFRGRKLLFFFSLFPLFVPPVLLAVGLVRFSEGGGMVADWLEYCREVVSDPLRGTLAMLVVLWITLRPLVTICAGARLRSVPADVEENALLDASPAIVAFRVSLRLAVPGALLGALLVFLRSMLESAVPAVFQVKAYAFETFAMLAAYYDEASAVAFATPLLAVGLVIGVATGVALNRYAASGLSFVTPPELFRKGRLRGVGLALCVLWVGPFWGLSVWAGLHPVRLLRALSETWPTVRDEIMRTTLDSAATAAGALVIAFFAASVACYGSRGLKLPAKILFTFPLLLPPVLLAVGMVSFWNQPGWRGDLAATPAVLLLGKTLLVLPILSWAMVAVLSTLDRSLIEASVLDGAGWRSFSVHLLLPALRPHVPLLSLVAFLLTFGEFEVSALLSPPGWTPFSVRLFTLLHYGVDDVVAGLSLIGFIGTLLFALVATWLARVRFLPE